MMDRAISQVDYNLHLVLKKTRVLADKEMVQLDDALQVAGILNLLFVVLSLETFRKPQICLTSAVLLDDTL